MVLNSKQELSYFEYVYLKNFFPDVSIELGGDVIINPTKSYYVGKKFILNLDCGWSIDFIKLLAKRNEVISRFEKYSIDGVKYEPYIDGMNPFMMPLPYCQKDFILNNCSLTTYGFFIQNGVGYFPQCMYMDDKCENDLTLIGYIKRQMNDYKEEKVRMCYGV